MILKKLLPGAIITVNEVMMEMPGADKNPCEALVYELWLYLPFDNLAASEPGSPAAIIFLADLL